MPYLIRIARIAGAVLTALAGTSQLRAQGAADNGGPAWAAVQQALGGKGVMQPGDVLKFGFPRSDLQVTVAGVALRPALALGSWVAFKRIRRGAAAPAMVMGDLVLAEDEVNPVIRALRDQGIQVTALHSHMLNESPRLFFMHFWANDDALTLARGLRSALDRMKVRRPPSKA